MCNFPGTTVSVASWGWVRPVRSSDAAWWLLGVRGVAFVPFDPPYSAFYEWVPHLPEQISSIQLLITKPNLVSFCVCVCPCPFIHLSVHPSICVACFCGDGIGFWCWGFKLTLTCLFPSALTHAPLLCLSDLAVFKDRLRMLTVGGMKITSLLLFCSWGLPLNRRCNFSQHASWGKLTHIHQCCKSLLIVLKYIFPSLSCLPTSRAVCLLWAFLLIFCCGEHFHPTLAIVALL